MLLAPAIEAETERQEKAKAEHHAKVEAARPLTPEEQAAQDLLDPIKIYARQKREREARERGEVTT